MLKAVEDISATKKRLKIEIPAETIEKEIQGSLEKVRQTATLPGFRSGKAPMTLIEKRFGKKVESEVLDKIIPQVYVDALQSADITPIADPVFEEHLDYKRNQPVTMTFTIEIMPKISDLKYDGISVKDIPVTVEDKDVEGVLERMREEKAAYEPSDGPVALHDLVSIDFAAEGMDLNVNDQVFKVGGSLFPEDVTQKLLGVMKGGKLSVETSFPEDHVFEKLAGKQAALAMTVKDIKKVRLPEMDDELAKDSGFDSLEAMKDHIREETRKAKAKEVARIQKAEIMKKLLDAHALDIPETMLESEMEMLVTREVMKKKDRAEELPAEEIEKLREKVKPDAELHVKSSLILTTVGKKEQVTVSEDDVKKAILNMSLRLGVPPENLIRFYVSKDGSLDGLKNALFEEKVLDLILAKAVIEKGE